MSELLPCPFCGGSDVHVENNFGREFWVQCRGCDASHGVIASDVPGALQLWNRRATTTAPEPAQAPVGAVPHPGSPEASAMMDSVLAEYGWPSNPKNAARAGFEAARRLLAAAPYPATGAPPLTDPSDAPMEQKP